MRSAPAPLFLSRLLGAGHKNELPEGMYCDTCRRQRPPSTTFCVLCGGRLHRREAARIHEELSKVEWLLTEIPRWDVTLVGRADAQRLREFYSREATWMYAELQPVTVTSDNENRGEAKSARLSPVAHVGAVAKDAARVDGLSGAVDADALVPVATVSAQPTGQPREVDVDALVPGANDSAQLSGQSREVDALVPGANNSAQPSGRSREADAAAPVAAANASAQSTGQSRDVGADALVPAANAFAQLTDAAALVPGANEPAGAEKTASPAATNAAHADAVSGVPAAAGAFDRASASVDETPRPPHPLEAVAPASAESRVVEAASSWSRVWKPFLTDSVGWFVGGFLILAGVYWLVADAWSEMTTLVRAVTVFGLAAGWTLAFFAWAKFLLRREATAPAGRMLERLSAAMAPLATVAVGAGTPAGQGLVSDTPLLFWPLVLGWAGVSGWLAHRATARVDVKGAKAVGLSAGLAAAMMGVAPLLTGLGVHATWLVALPVGLAAWAFAAGPRQEPGAARFLVAAFAWTVTLFAARLEVALVMAGLPLTVTLLAPTLAAGVASVRWLARPPTRAADALSVLVVVAQAGLLFASIDVFTPKPAFVVTALLAAATTWSFARARVSLNSARWLPVAYAFAYLAYQRIDQLVPQVVRDAYTALKARLGYSTAPLPASYGSVYAVLFVVAVGFLAVRWARAVDPLKRREGEVLLDTTAVASALSSLLAVVSLGTDARPAVIATPVLAVMTLLLALRSGRLPLTIAGTLGAVCAAAALSIGLNAPVAVGAVALALALPVLKTTGHHRLVLSVGAGVLGLWGVGAGLLATPSLLVTLSVGLSAAALVVVARELESAELLDVAWFAPLLTVVTAARWLSPDLAPLTLALASAGAGGLTLLGGRWRSGRLMAVIGALSAVAWAVLVTGPVWPGVVLLVSAAAFFLCARSSSGVAAAVLEACGWALALSSLLPEGAFPWPTPLVPQALAGLVVLVASVQAVRSGRTWRTAWLASLGVLFALTGCVHLDTPALVLATAIALLATPALLSAVTVPLASLLLGLELVLHLPGSQLPVAFSALAVGLAAVALLDRVALTSKLLAGQRLAWPAVVMSGLSLVPALAAEPSMRWLPMLVAAVVPVLWSFALGRPAARLFATALVSATAFWAGGPWLLAAPVVAVAVAFSLWARAHAGPGGRRSEPRTGGASAVAASVTTAAQVGMRERGVAGSDPLTAKAEVVAAPVVALSVQAGGRVRAAEPLTGGAEAVAAAQAGKTEPLAGGEATRPVRDLMTERLTLSVTALSALLSTLVAVSLPTPPLLFVAWALALAVLPVGALAVRLVLAAAVMALAPSALLGSAAVVALLGVGFALRHLPGRTSTVLGARSLAYAQPAAALSALGLAAVVFLQHPEVATQAVLVGALVGAALLLGLSVLVPVALLAAVVDLRLLVTDGAFSLAPWTVWLALAAAAGALALRRGFALEAVEDAWERLGAPGKHLDVALWVGAAVLVLLAAPQPSLSWLAPGLVLLVTPRAVESVVAALLVALTLWLRLAPLDAAVAMAVFGGALAWFGALREGDASQARLHTGWALVAVSLLPSAELHAWQLPVCWSLAAVTAWAVVRAKPSLRWVGWAAVWAASHAVLAWAGVTLSSGAPKALILPWFALASVLVALRPSLSPWVRQHAGIGATLRGVAVVELAAGAALCPGGHGREAVAVVLAVGLSLWLAWRDAKEDEASGVWLGVLSLSAGFLLTRVLFGGPLGLPESVAALVLAGVAGVLGQRSAESSPDVAAALRQVAMAWPAVGLVLAPWGAPVPMAALLVAIAVHYALVAQAGASTLASLASAVAFNAAVVTLWFGSGWGEAQYVLVPAGLSGLVLVHLFASELGEVWAARLRAVSVGLVYAAAAFRPLAIDAPGAFFLCVALCVAGVAAGIALRVRSFVTLGSVFLVTTVVATLVRWGVREPRLGALFLSALGLAIVAFMVVVTTKKTELLERYKRVRGALEHWEG